MSDPLMVEERSRLSILVIEDNPQYLQNAAEALKGHDLALASNMDEVIDHMTEIGTNQRPQFDLILSDVHVPDRAGDGPQSILSTLLNLAYGSEIPVCFVTRADHHGMLDQGDEGYVSIVAMNFSDISETLAAAGREEKPGEKDVFRMLKASSKESVKTSGKTPDIWAQALQMLQNCSAEQRPLGGAIRQVRELGMDVLFKGLVPQVVPRGMGKDPRRK